MNDLFTVKLDLSSVILNEKEHIYVLLVDPTKMKLIYQFKLWVRFLFSIDCSIKFVYEGAVIHDLEDVAILKLLKTVEVEHGDSVGERKHQEELIAKVNKYDEWRESVTPIVDPHKQNKLIYTNSQSDRQFHDVRVSHVESTELNLSNGRYNQQKKHQSVNENGFQFSSYNGSKRIANVENETRINSGITCNTFDLSSNSLQLEEHETDLNGDMCKNNTSSQKDISYQMNSHETPKNVDKLAKTRSETTRQESSAKRRSIHKPFSLYNFLHTLKCQESNFNDNNKTCHDTALELDGDEGSGFKLNGVSKNYEDESQVLKRKRKRIRKHKNQKNKIITETEICKETLTPLVHNKEKLKSESVSPKPKHIRFDAEEDSTEYIVNKPTQDGSLIVKDETSKCNFSSEPSLPNDYNYEKIALVNNDSYPKEKNDTITISVEASENIQENEGDKVKEMSMISDEDINKDSISNNENIMDVLRCLRKKSNAPPVFDRFGTCT